MPREIIDAQPLVNGSDLPQFELKQSDGQFVTLNDLMKERGVVIAFLHGTWCPYCLHQLKRLNHIAPQLADHHVGLACISKDSADIIYGYEASAQPPLRFIMLSDSAPSLSHQFGIYDEGHDSPYTAVFYANATHKIQYADVSSDPDCYPNLGRLLEVIKHGPKGDPFS